MKLHGNKWPHFLGTITLKKDSRYFVKLAAALWVSDYSFRNPGYLDEHGDKGGEDWGGGEEKGDLYAR